MNEVCKMIEAHRPLSELVAEQEALGEAIKIKINRFNKLRVKERTRTMKIEMLELMQQYDDLNNEIRSHPLSEMLVCETTRMPVGISIN